MEIDHRSSTRLLKPGATARTTAAMMVTMYVDGNRRSQVKVTPKGSDLGRFIPCLLKPKPVMSEEKDKVISLIGKSVLELLLKYNILHVFFFTKAIENAAWEICSR